MPELTRSRWTRRTLITRLPDDGAAGATHYRAPGEAPPLDALALEDDERERLGAAASASATGSVLFVGAADAMLVLPPFAIERSIDYSELYAAPLREVIGRRRAVAVLLLRLGGFSVGFFHGEALVASKTDQRFVKNRHRKGGQSQRRFERIREKQIDELFGKACETAHATLAPYEAEVEHVFFGGDRHTLLAFRKQCSYFERYGARVMARVLPVAGDPRRASLDAMPREIWTSDVWVGGTEKSEVGGGK